MALAMAMAALALAPATPVAAVEADSSPPAITDQSVHVRRTGDRFSIDAVMHVPTPPALVWAVLTDFAHMTRFVPNLTDSEIVERSGSTLKVRQKGVARFGPFSTAFESIRLITLNAPHEIRSQNIGGNLKHMESTMTLAAEGSGTRLSYHADVVPAFWFPPLIGPSVVRHETAEQFSAMMREMQRRQ